MVEIRIAGPDDIPAIVAMRASAGWQAYQWALHDAMRPPHARFWIGFDGGEPVATGSGISYGAFGVVGNMVVAETHRRQGLGSAVLERVLDFLSSRGATSVELSATADGRPLYERHGFVSAGGSAMVAVPRDAPLDVADDLRVTPAAPENLNELAAYDVPRFGGDRAALLAAALADPQRPVLLSRRGAELVGYAVLRLEGGRLGPWLADDTAVASALLGATIARAPEALTIGTNIGHDNGAGVHWLRGIASAFDRWDGRMRLGPEPERRSATIYGNAVGALG